jgi:hypothetical protein
MINEVLVINSITSQSYIDNEQLCNELLIKFNLMSLITSLISGLCN